MEYCRYILSQVENPYVKGFTEEKINKADFYKKVEDVIKAYKNHYKIKDNHFSSDKLFINTMEFFLRSNVIFGKNEREQTLYKLYKETKESLKIEKERLKNKQEVSKEKMFEIIMNFSILCSNTVENLEGNTKEKNEIQYKTTEIMPEKIIKLIGDSINIHERQKKVSKKKKWGVINIVNMNRNIVGVKHLPIVGGVIVGGIAAKSLWDALYKDKVNKDECLYLYLWCLIAATYTKNEEFKERNVYGW